MEQCSDEGFYDRETEWGNEKSHEIRAGALESNPKVIKVFYNWRRRHSTLEDLSPEKRLKRNNKK